MKEGYVYILSNSQRTDLYTGVTSDLIHRVNNHKMGKGSLFSEKYRIHYLMYYEAHPPANAEDLNLYKSNLA